MEHLLNDLPYRVSSIINNDFVVNNNSFNFSDVSSKEIQFSGQVKNYCICFIDMMNSTKIINTLSKHLVRKYYAVFLNSTAKIVKNFGGIIIKNAGDCLIYYFPKTDNLSNEIDFKNVIECNLTIVAAHEIINASLLEENLPPLDYRISVDYGEVEIAKSTSSQGEDLFGSAVNVCAKINSKAPPNTTVIGEKLYSVVKSYNEYNFKEIGKYNIFNNTEEDKYYAVYLVSSILKQSILNPFQRMPLSTNYYK